LWFTITGKSRRKIENFQEEIINSPDIKIEDGYRLIGFFITGHV